MARPGRQERNRAARSFRQLRRFHHVINSDKVFGTHTGCDWMIAGLGRSLLRDPRAHDRVGHQVFELHKHVELRKLIMWPAPPSHATDWRAHKAATPPRYR